VASQRKATGGVGDMQHNTNTGRAVVGRGSRGMYLSKVIVLALALLNEVGKLGSQELGCHLGRAVSAESIGVSVRSGGEVVVQSSRATERQSKDEVSVSW
jgi:hypothetical protein